MSIRRLTVLLGAIALVFALPACTDDDDALTQPCDTCPEEMVHVTPDCETCDVSEPIGVAIENRGVITVITDVCSWRLMGVGDEGWEEVQRYDCSVIYPTVLGIDPGATEILLIVLDPETLPPLDAYERYAIEITLRWEDEGEPMSAGVMTHYVELVTPGAPLR